MTRSRWPIVVVLICSLFATGLTRYVASERRTAGRRFGTATADSGRSRLSQMNSFALALLLGGLRGPLVMILWSNSESQKSEKNLEGVDTQIEWIRLLQPEFDTVHIFQIWNKAYNLSVQMASLSNKYLTIIDAIDYAHKVDQERPDNINILYAIGGIYGDKLGDSAEKYYYTKRVREESQPHVSKQRLKPDDPGYRRLDLDPVLDKDGNVLPQYLKSTGVHLADPNIADPNIADDVYDGSELSFLTRFQPYKYGVAPHGFGYAYRKRAQLLQRLAQQNHAQLSEVVIDSRPALDLKKWAEVEWEQARRCEIVAMGKAIPAERIDMEPVTQDAAPDAQAASGKGDLIDQAIFSYDLGARLTAAADAEYVEHLKRYTLNFQQYESHRDELHAERALMLADHDYLLAMRAAPDSPERAKLLATAKEQYRRAQVHYALIILRYCTPNEALASVLPPGVTRQNFPTAMTGKADELQPEQVLPMLQGAMQASQQMQVPMSDDANEYLKYVERASARLKHL